MTFETTLDPRETKEEAAPDPPFTGKLEAEGMTLVNARDPEATGIEADGEMAFEITLEAAEESEESSPPPTEEAAPEPGIETGRPPEDGAAELAVTTVEVVLIAPEAEQATGAPKALTQMLTVATPPKSRLAPAPTPLEAAKVALRAGA